MFAIADKYLISDLRQRAKVHIFKDLSEDNASELLFGAAWKYPDLKEAVMKYVVENFKTIRRTESFKNAVLYPSAQPHCGAILMEVWEMYDP
jgi:hypothetical protein